MIGNRRAYIAAILAFIYPGLGHLYLRVWLRAIAWFALAIGTVTLVVPKETLEVMGSGNLDAMLAASRTLPVEVLLTVLAVRVLNVVDAFLVAARPDLVGADSASQGSDDVPSGTCPSCGKDLDEDLDFCPWCTQRLDVDTEEDGSTPNEDGLTPFR